MKILRKVIIIVVLIAGTFGYKYITEEIQVKSTQESLEYIHEHFNVAGELTDYQNAIRMNDPQQDIKLFVKDNKVTIKFGVIEMNWTAKQFMDEDNLRKLEQIYIYPVVDPETNRLTIYYKGEELPRWVS